MASGPKRRRRSVTPRESAEISVRPPGMPTDLGTAHPFASAGCGNLLVDRLSRARGRPVLRELHQRPTRPTLAKEHGVTQKVEAIYTGGVLKPTRDLCL